MINECEELRARLRNFEEKEKKRKMRKKDAKMKKRRSEYTERILTPLESILSNNELLRAYARPPKSAVEMKAKVEEILEYNSLNVRIVDKVMGDMEKEFVMRDHTLKFQYIKKKQKDFGANWIEGQKQMETEKKEVEIKKWLVRFSESLGSCDTAVNQLINLFVEIPPLPQPLVVGDDVSSDSSDDDEDDDHGSGNTERKRQKKAKRKENATKKVNDTPPLPPASGENGGTVPGKEIARGNTQVPPKQLSRKRSPSESVDSTGKKQKTPTPEDIDMRILDIVDKHMESTKQVRNFTPPSDEQEEEQRMPTNNASTSQQDLDDSEGHDLIQKRKDADIRTVLAQCQARYTAFSILSCSQYTVQQKKNILEAAELDEHLVKESFCLHLLKNFRNDANPPDFEKLKIYLDRQCTPDAMPGGSNSPKKSLVLTGPMYVDPMTVTSNDILKHVQDFMIDGKNKVFDFMHSIQLPDSDDFASDIQKYQENKGGFKMIRKNCEDFILPTPKMTLSSRKEAESNDYHQWLEQQPISVTANFVNAIGFDWNLFSMQTLGKLHRAEDTIEVMRQLTQDSDSNFVFPESENCWKLVGGKTKVSFKKFAENHEKLKQVFFDAAKQLESNCSPDVFKAFSQTALQEQLLVEDNMDESIIKLRDNFKPLFLSFGTNVDMLDKTTFAKQYREIEQKIPRRLQPSGTNNLLDFTNQTFGGINTPQVYFKAAGSRTAAHIENAALYSVNINLGDGECEWFAVPPKYARNMEKVLEKMRSAGDSSEDRNIGAIYKENTWPDLQVLAKHKIPVHRFIQRKNDMVFVGPMTFHWVQTNGITTNLSYNVAVPSVVQFNAIRVMYDHALRWNVTPNIPFVTMLWGIAEKKYFGETPKNDDFYNTVKNALTRSLFHELVQLKKVESMGAKPVKTWSGNEKWSRGVILCSDCGEICHNVVVRQAEKKSLDESSCINCMSRIKEPQVFIKWTTEHLMKTFNDYTK